MQIVPTINRDLSLNAEYHTTPTHARFCLLQTMPPLNFTRAGNSQLLPQYGVIAICHNAVHSDSSRVQKLFCGASVKQESLPYQCVNLNGTREQGN